MEKLQNDFTTPKQSKRLLELGVPEWTANCVLRHYCWANDNSDESGWELPCIVWSADALDRFIDDEYDRVLPCWSAGRLMEIFDKCQTCRTYCHKEWAEYTAFDDYIEYIICAFSRWHSTLDFSKLKR